MARAALLALAALAAGSAAAVQPSRGAAVAKERISGRFDVSIAPEVQPDGVPNGRMRIRKTFHGLLSGTASGEMLTSSDAKDGSGAYVAIERFTGRLGNRSGSFFVVHRGIMDRGRPDLSITVVPGSGTGGLQGLTGTLQLDLSSKDHAFTFDYALPDPNSAE